MKPAEAWNTWVHRMESGNDLPPASAFILGMRVALRHSEYAVALSEAAHEGTRAELTDGLLAALVAQIPIEREETECNEKN